MNKARILRDLLARPGLVPAVGAHDVPVIADCDNGYGNAVNVVRTVEEYERAGIAGLCLEDNIFPKTCSLYPGMRRELLPIDEHWSRRGIR